jgi:hypothetical protein
MAGLAFHRPQNNHNDMVYYMCPTSGTMDIVNKCLLVPPAGLYSRVVPPAGLWWV